MVRGPIEEPVERTRLNNRRSEVGPRVGGRVALARLALLWEALWPALWPAVAVAAAFVVLVLLDALPQVAGWLHALILAGFALGFLWLLCDGLRAIRLPRRESAVRRLERASDLSHRPLQVLSDDLAAGADDRASEELWRLHRRRMAEQAKHLKVGAPAPGLARRDPFGLRGALVLLLVVASTIGIADSPQRLSRAVSPQFAFLAPSAPPRLEIWITPPAYTGLAPLFPKLATVEAADGATGPRPVLEVPVNSVLSAQIAGGGGKSVLTLGDKRMPFEAIDVTNARIVGKIEAGGTLEISQNGESLGAWTLNVVMDETPRIAFTEPPSGTERSALRIAYSVGDDYGVSEIGGEIRRSYEGGTVVGKEVVELDLPLPGVNVKTASEISFHDLTPHKWAGLAVVLRLRAKDGAGQVAYSEDAKLVLPERKFTHPVARAVIEQRRRLTSEPERRRPIMEALDDVARRPGAYDNSTVTFLALTAAIGRLLHERHDTAVDPVRGLLWDTALGIEDGTLSLAERELRRAQQAVMKALAENASDAELERLMNELQAALEKFMRAMAEQLRNQPQNQQAMPIDPRMRFLQSTDLRRMMEQIRRLMRSGARQAAREMLAQLQNMLENLRSGKMFSGNQQNQRGSRALNQLQDLIRRQNELMERTFRQSQSRAGTPPPGQSQAGAATQRALREALQRLREMLAQGRQPGQKGPGQALGRAGRAMEGATGALDRNAPGDAVGPQGQAIDALQQAGRSMIQQMMNRMARGQGPGMQRQFNPLNMRRDPLGRYLPGQDGMDTRDVKIPDESAVQRAQRILDELRRRSSQRFRPRFELDYIDRLLRRF